MIKYQVFVAGLSLLLAGSACQQAPQKKGEEAEGSPAPMLIQVEAEDFAEQEGDFAVIDHTSGKAVRLNSEKGWLSFSIDVPAAGRYQVEALLSAPDGSDGSCWLEDYVDNPDGRTYNVTGIMKASPAAGQSFVAIHKDGSPFNQGTHFMKLHLEGAGTAVDGFSIRLIRPHKSSPMVQEQGTDGSEWKLAWSDEFEGPEIDTSKWTYDIGDWGWGNNELQYYTENRAQNARIEDGMLIIEAHKNDQGSAWTSARLTTRGKASFLYGRIEFRAKVPSNKGNWAAGWTLGDDYVDEKSWPYCGEIDIMESVGYEMDNESGDGKAHASIHCGAYYFKLGNQPTATVEVQNMEKAFHTYAVDWTPAGITAYVDGQAYFEYTDTSTDLAWPFSKAQNIILNLAMGGGWGGAQGMDEQMTKQTLAIDYVRVYELQ